MHSDLPVRAKTLGIEVEVVHNASIFECGGSLRFVVLLIWGGNLYPFLHKYMVP